MKRIVKNPKQRRAEIIAVATELFLTLDYESTSMKKIMDKLNIAKGTIYHYFQSKEQLLEAVVYQMVEDYMANLKHVVAQTDDNALDKMRLLMLSGNVANEQAQLMRNLHRSGNVALHTRLLALTVTKLAPLYADIIEQGCQEGTFSTTTPLESAEFLLAGIQFMTDLGSFPWDKETLLRRNAVIPAVLEKQFGAPQGSFDFLHKHLEMNNE